MIQDQADRLRRIADGQAAFAPKPGSGPAGQRLAIRRHQARTIAIASGKGGVGKTNLTVNLGLALAKQGAAVTIVDLDLGLANIDVILGVTARLTLREVINGRCTVEQALVEGPYGSRLVCGGSGIVELAGLSDRHREQLIESLSVVDSTSDVVLLDIGAGISSNVIDFIIAAGEVIVVTTTEPTAMTDAYALIKVVSRQARGTVFNLVVNQVANPREGQEVALTMLGVARRFLNVQINYLGDLPTDPKLLAAIKRQVPALLAFPTCPFSTRVQHLAARLCPPTTATAARPANSFGQFLRRLTGRVA